MIKLLFLSLPILFFSCSNNIQVITDHYWAQSMFTQASLHNSADFEIFNIGENQPSLLDYPQLFEKQFIYLSPFFLEQLNILSQTYTEVQFLIESRFLEHLPQNSINEDQIIVIDTNRLGLWTELLQDLNRQLDVSSDFSVCFFHYTYSQETEIEAAGLGSLLEENTWHFFWNLQTFSDKDDLQSIPRLLQNVNIEDYDVFLIFMGEHSAKLTEYLLERNKILVPENTQFYKNASEIFPYVINIDWKETFKNLKKPEHSPNKIPLFYNFSVSSDFMRKNE